MSGPFGSSQWMYNAGGGFYDYEIDNSLRFNDNDSANLTRNFASNGTRTTWTFSCWLKRGSINTSQEVFVSGLITGVYYYTRLGISTSNKMSFIIYNDANQGWIYSANLLRDVGAWYHLVWVFDTTNGTAADRMRMYINGERVTSFATETFGTTYPSLNGVSSIMNSSYTHKIGRTEDGQGGGNFLDGYLAEVNFIDGTALEPTSFGETKSGVWIPKEYSGSYGTNGFHLEFAGNANDTSGNGNNFTANSISSYDYVSDSPTNNFNTFSSVIRSNSGSLSEGNLKSSSVSGGSSNYGPMSSYNVYSGKWYFEFRITGGTARDIYAGAFYARTDNNIRFGKDMTVVYNGLIYVDGSVDQSGLANPATNDVFGFAVDVDNSTCQVYRNGSAYGTQTNFSGSSYVDNGFMGMGHYHGSSSTNSTAVVNYGQDSTFAGATTAGGNSDSNGYGDFKYAPPSGFLAMCSQNLPEPTFSPADDATPEDYFNSAIWTGNSANGRDIVTGHATDFVWIKSRSNATNHYLFDRLRGVNNQLLTNATSAEAIYSTDRMTAFNSDGFEVGAFTETNGSGRTFVGWSWMAGGTGVSNTDGSVTTTVSANPDAGFSVVGYSGSGTTSTFGHGLGTPVDCMIIKRRNGTTNWIVKHKGLPNYNTTGYIQLDTSIAYLNDPNAGLTGTNNTTFTISNSYGTQNTSGGTYIAYCFSEREGYSKIGSYRGNGSTDGTFVYTGFKPAWVLIRLYDNGGTNWLIYDVKRDLFNVTDEALLPNSSSATGGSANAMDIVSNGFKFRSSAGSLNANNYNYIYMAFAEQPFKYANAR